jgi:hypothetical protein
MSVAETPVKKTFMWPADYYSAPTPTPVLPQWATFGCGAASVVVLILVVAGGAILSSGGLTKLIDFATGMSISEMKGQYAADVTPEQKKVVAAELDLVLKNLREEKLSVAKLQPFLDKLRDVSSDKKVTSQEAAALEALARKINSGAKR